MDDDNGYIIISLYTITSLLCFEINLSHFYSLFGSVFSRILSYESTSIMYVFVTKDHFMNEYIT